MKTKTLVLMIIALSLLAAGLIVACIGASLMDFDFLTLNTAKSTVSTHNVTEDFHSIAISEKTSDIVFLPSEDGSVKVVCNEQKKMTHAVSVQNGVLTVMCGAAVADFEEARDVAMAFAAAVTRIGEVGCGQLAKMCNQICIAGILEALSEAIAFGENAGLDVPLVLDVISKGAAQSWQMQNRGGTMVKREFDFGFAVDWMRKDLGLCLAEAKKNGSSLPLVAMVDQFYGEVQAMGGSRYDTSSLVMRLPTKK